MNSIRSASIYYICDYCMEFFVCREHFQQICGGSVEVPNLTIMKDVAISKSEFVSGEKAITKIQDFQYYEPLFDYCKQPGVS